MKNCAFLTLEKRGKYVIDDELAIQPLKELGWHTEELPWTQADRDWSEFDLVVIRSTWDYWDYMPEFIATLENIDKQARLANPLSLVKWNLEKTYLRDLSENRGIEIVPTIWLDSMHAGSIEELREQLGNKDIVVKPLVGGSGERVVRVSPERSLEYRKHVETWYAQQPCMVQAFIPGVLTEGEYSLFFFNGQYSHAISKVPAQGEFRSQEERGAQIRMCAPGDRLYHSACKAIEALDQRPLYARVDMLRGEAGEWMLMELELVEPSLYLRTAYSAAGEFAAAIDQWTDS